MDSIIQLGGSVKALGQGRVGGHVVLFTGPDSPDLVGDFFTAQTDFDLYEGKSVPVLFEHGLDPVLGKRRLGRATLKADEVGVWFEAQLALRDEYERKIYELVEAGKLGLSSGSAPHLVTREPVKSAFHIKEWPIIEASLTPTPCEPRTTVLSLKSYEAFIADAIIDALPTGKTYTDESQTVLAAVQNWVERTRNINDLRIKEGRQLSAANRERISTISRQLKEVSQQIDELLEATNPVQLAPASDIAQALAQFERLRLQQHSIV